MEGSSAERPEGPTTSRVHRQCRMLADAESVMNLALSDPPRWGWTAAGTIADLLPPHERSRRRSTAVAYRKLKRKRTSSSTAAAAAAAAAAASSRLGGKGVGRGDTPAAPSVTTSTSSSLKATPETAGTTASSQQAPTKPGIGESTSASTADTAKPAPVPTTKAVTGERKSKEEAEEAAPASKDLSQHAALAAAPSTTQQQQQQTKGSTTQPTSVAPATSLTPSKPPLATGKLFGFKRNLVGMEVKKIEPAENNKNSSGGGDDCQKKKSGKKGGGVNNNRKRGASYECRINALSPAEDSDGVVLDMYSYHRGREGYEPRDPETGELRCPLEATDTNCNYDAGRLSFNVTIEFPLQDEDGAGKDRGSSGDDERDVPIYSETLSWDLSDTNMPSPMVVATNIANDFGLKYGQMMDLALSIQSQIDAHTQQYLSYWTPISVEDPAGMERQYVGSSIQTHRFGQVLQMAPGGTRLAPKERQRIIAATRSSGSRASSANGSTTASGRRKSTTNTASSSSKIQIIENVDENLGEEFIKEAKRRSRAASILDISKKCTNGKMVGRMERLSNGPCHICRKRCNVAYTFGCGLPAHSYCEAHCKTRLDDFNKDQPIISYCPICALHCSCAKCSRKMVAVASDLKSTMESQGTTLEDTKYENILFKCKNLQGAKPTNLSGTKRRASEITAEAEPEQEDTFVTPKRPKQSTTTTAMTTTSTTSSKQVPRPKRANNARTENRARLLVPKPPLYEFPREIYGSLELEAGTPEDYLKVYTSSGTYLSDDFPEVWSEQQQDKSGLDSESVPTSNGEIVEDGNVDFCHVCRNHGNLLCCDFCPRAFHIDCIREDSNPAKTERWECVVCRKEKEGLPDDVIDTKKSMDLICASFADVKVDDENGAKEIEALSGIHEMVSKLMEYDFGYMFAAPVDVQAIPGYTDTVKHPMDLGTICAKLANGGYASILKNGGTFDDVLVTVLQDIELVWHNCFLFNFEGSAINRMAVVQRRRALAMQEKSLQHLLSDRVKSAVKDYIRSCEVMRGQLTSKSTLALDSAPSTNAKEKELRSRKPKGKHKITVKLAKPTVNRPIAIFDSVTGRIVKIYTSMTSASHAAHSLISLGHRCELPPTHDLVKNVVLKSSSDPSVLLFGYRWLLLEDLRAGRVSFREPPFEGIQVRHGENTFTYLSLDEATSFPHLDRKLSVEQLRQQLSNLECGSAWTSIGGKLWRRLAAPGQEKLGEPTSQPGGTQDLVVEEKPDEVPVFGKKFLAQSAVIKEDLISKRKLIGFETIQAAFQDWKQTAVFSPSFPTLETKSMENFKKYYLDGERNIDGLVWRSQEPSVAEPSTMGGTAILESVVPAINGVAPSPLVRSAYKRSRETEPTEANGNEGRKQTEHACLSVDPTKKTPSLGDGQANRGTPMMGIQLF